MTFINRAFNEAVDRILGPQAPKGLKEEACASALEAIRTGQAQSTQTVATPSHASYVAPLLSPKEVAELKKAATLVKFFYALPDIQYMGDKPSLTGSLLQQAEQARAWLNHPGARELQYLNLSGKNLHALPPEIENFTGAWAMNLADNHLKDLPPELMNCTQLQILSVANNELTALPDNFNNLQNLTDLVLSGNQFSGTMPHQLTELRNLQELDIHDNNITDFPAGMGCLTQLRMFRYRGNPGRNPGLELSPFMQAKYQDQADRASQEESDRMNQQSQELYAEKARQNAPGYYNTPPATPTSGYYNSAIEPKTAPASPYNSGFDDESPKAPASPYNSGFDDESPKAPASPYNSGFDDKTPDTNPPSPYHVG